MLSTETKIIQRGKERDLKTAYGCVCTILTLIGRGDLSLGDMYADGQMRKKVNPMRFGGRTFQGEGT